MAHVARAASARGKPRGQIFLVTALGLAILFVSLALVVNTVIFTENQATRSSDLGGVTDAQRYQAATHDSVSGTVAYANYHVNTSHAALNTELRDGLLAYQNVSERLFATSDRSVTAALNATTNGTRVYQTTASRNFTAGTGSENWTLAGDVTRTRQFRMNVQTEDLLDAGAGSDEQFSVVAADGVDEWRIYVYNDSTSSDVIVEVDPPTAAGGTCSVTGAPSVWVNLTDGSVAGQPCAPLQFAGGLNGSYSITYENAHLASGTYSLIVDNSSLANSPGPQLHAPGGGQPTATHAIYSTTVTVTYRTPRLQYETTVRVAPGEPT